MRFSSRQLLCGFFILLLVGVRFAHINIPIVENYNSITRQSIVASIARNFYDHGFNFFYPEINENGNGPYLFNGEMPIHSYLMALSYKLCGGVHEWASRSVSAIFSIFCLLFMYLMIRLHNQPNTAWYALILLGFSPLNLALSRSLQPEATMLMGTVGGLYFFCQYMRSERVWHLLVSAILIFIAVGTKIYNLYILLPIVFVAFQKDGWRFIIKKRYWAYLAFVCSALIWYWYMWNAGKNLDLAYTPYDVVKNRGPQDMTYFGLLFNTDRLFIFFKIFIGHLLTPIGFILFGIGLIKAKRDKNASVFYVWLLATIICMLILWRTVIDHSYYQLPLILPSAYFFGYGLMFAINDQRTRCFAAICILISACITFFALQGLYKGVYKITAEKQAIVTAGNRLDALIPKDALVVASYGSSPIQLYYANRNGWILDVQNLGEDELIRSIKKYLGLGAKYFVISRLEDLYSKPRFETYLRTNYSIIVSEKNFLIAELA